MQIYLAGYDVFRRDAAVYGDYLKALCAAAGHQGLYPLDNCVPSGLENEDAARWIARANMAMLEQADAVIANLAPFRGMEPDSGTVFEIGVAVALNKPVWVYFPDKGDLRSQVGTDKDGRCQDGFSVEDFCLPRNLMLACHWIDRHETFEQALDACTRSAVHAKR